jgi:hypothetical protein
LPALEAQLERLTRSHTQALAVSIDSAAVHAAFGNSLGGISYPMLADFHPKGALASGLGVYLDNEGTTDRATVIVDAAGVVRHVSSTGKRDMEAVAKLCEEIDAAYEGDLPDAAKAEGLAADSLVYVRDNCQPSRSVLWARTNLHLDGLQVKNVSQDTAALAELKERTGAETAPVLLESGKVTAESHKIVSYLSAKCAAP